MLFAALAALALAQAPDQVAEEVVVYGDPLAPWDQTRWWVAAESLTDSGALRLTTPGGSFRAPAWQVSALLFCQVLEHRRSGGLVECTPEAVAVRAVSVDSWQRPEDRRRVDGGLSDLRREMLGARIHLRVRDHGSVHLVQNEDGAGASAALVLERAINAFHLDLPEYGWFDGQRWEALSEPLLDLSEAGEGFGLERVVHSAHSFRGHTVIQTLGEANKETVVGVRRPTSSGPSIPLTHAERFMPEWRAHFEEVTVPSQLRLEAAAVFDRERGFMTERVWSMVGTGSYPVRRIGRLELLDADTVVDLGPSGQVAPPGVVRPGLLPWVSLDPGASR
ncbi:MAG: hypothetical protein ACI8PZ_005239 [Myxococcota bacterium]|jgi:hypothetical protein